MVRRTGEGDSAAAENERRQAESKARARSLRKNGTKAEAILWNEIKANQLGGFHFVRQFPIGRYFADFACRKRKLVVELDGSQHIDSAHDRRRDAFIRAQGYAIMRFWNEDVLKHRAEVCDTILAGLDGRLRDNVVSPDLRFACAPSEPAAIVNSRLEQYL